MYCITQKKLKYFIYILSGKRLADLLSYVDSKILCLQSHQIIDQELYNRNFITQNIYVINLEKTLTELKYQKIKLLEHPPSIYGSTCSLVEYVLESLDPEIKKREIIIKQIIDLSSLDNSDIFSIIIGYI